jgi:transposase
LVFVDESGVTPQMTRHYGRAPAGQRVEEATPQSHWRTLTVLGAITQKGVVASMTIESPTDGDVFLVFVEQVLGPKLQAGAWVIMDNLRAHKVEGVREKIEARGANLVYLPPYSPDFNPIEQIWSKVKQGLRSAKARTVEALDQAVGEALNAITPENTAGCFAGCGYGLQ